MKAKNLITGLSEAEGDEQSMTGPPPPAGTTSGPRNRPMRPRGDRPTPFDPSGARPPRMLSGPETSILKDVLLLINTELTGNDFDGAIVRKLMANQDLDPGELQHILDEAGRIRELPEQHKALLQKVYEITQRKQQ
jgi:hypothetical protein